MIFDILMLIIKIRFYFKNLDFKLDFSLSYQTYGKGQVELRLYTYWEKIGCVTINEIIPIASGA